MTYKLFLIPALALITACGEMGSLGGHHKTGRRENDKTTDYGRDSKHLSQLVAGIWVDPNGCDHWIIDDGVEGYMDARLDRYGKPVCSGAAPAEIATGPLKTGGTKLIGDPI